MGVNETLEEFARLSTNQEHMVLVSMGSPLAAVKKPAQKSDDM